MLAYSGDDHELAAITKMVQRGDREVVVLACDLGHGPALAELRDRALAAGAARCHALDLREEFLRDQLAPALSNGTALDRKAFLERKIIEIARLENARVSPVAASATAAPALAPYPFEHPAHVEVAFDAGLPVAINSVAMTLSEIVESLETIARTPAIDLLRLAFNALPAGDRSVTIRVAKDGLSVMTPAVVA